MKKVILLAIILVAIMSSCKTKTQPITATQSDSTVIEQVVDTTTVEVQQ